MYFSILCITEIMTEICTVLLKTSFLVRINLPNILESWKQIHVLAPVSALSKFSRITKAFTAKVLFHLSLFLSILHPAP